MSLFKTPIYSEEDLEILKKQAKENAKLIGRFFKPEDFLVKNPTEFAFNVPQRELIAKIANMKIVQNFEPNDYQDIDEELQKEINLYVLVDSSGYICYTGYSEELVKSYKESNGFNDKTVIKLTGFLPEKEK